MEMWKYFHCQKLRIPSIINTTVQSSCIRRSSLHARYTEPNNLFRHLRGLQRGIVNTLLIATSQDSSTRKDYMVKHNGMHVGRASREECDAYLHRSIQTSLSITFDPKTCLPQMFIPVVLNICFGGFCTYFLLESKIFSISCHVDSQ